MAANDMFVKEYQERFEKKVRENEMAALEHWKAQLDKVISMRPDSVASMQAQIMKITEMMNNRIKILKKE
jgi:aminoglycoside N3'-acetyltransferase